MPTSRTDPVALQEGFQFGSLEEELCGKPRSNAGYTGALKGRSFSVDRSQKKSCERNLSRRLSPHKESLQVTIRDKAEAWAMHLVLNSQPNGVNTSVRINERSTTRKPFPAPKGHLKRALMASDCLGPSRNLIHTGTTDTSVWIAPQKPIREQTLPIFPPDEA
ncbi:unnamed protein product [Pleuronectes platessa]|uniref:Uncharacterized protein n=1 Tax=Pleuronectes platessa TaxID=8262 RepID=A0A9N7TQB1_PLEPL|nr:unnamed protein product [Pleuronectes platessa]